MSDAPTPRPSWGPWPASRWDEPSRAVIACDGEGNGCVLYTEGPHLRAEIEENGGGLDNLWLDDSPAGIHVWVGSVRVYQCNHPLDPVEYDAELVTNEWRPPTPEEWEAIQAGRSPWPDEHWERYEREQAEQAALEAIHADDEVRLLSDEREYLGEMGPAGRVADFDVVRLDGVVVAILPKEDPGDD